MITYAAPHETGELFFVTASDTSAEWAEEEKEALLEIGESEKNRAFNLALINTDDWDGTEKGRKHVACSRKKWKGGGFIFTSQTKKISFLVQDAARGCSNIGVIDHK